MNIDDWFERGHVALITGASKGLGRAVAMELAGRGLRVALTARGNDELERVSAELAQRTDVLALPGDVADLSHVHALVVAVEERFGRLDLLVNNASTLGRSPMPALQNVSPATFDRLFMTNVFAPLHLIQHSLPLLRDSGGTIVNVSSDAGVNAYPGWGGYGASKAALEHVSRTLAAELEGSGVTVIVADPGDMNTEMHRDAEPGVDLSGLPLPENVAPALLAAIAAPRAAFARFTLQALDLAPV